LSTVAHHLATASAAATAGSALDVEVVGADIVATGLDDPEVVVVGVGSDPPVHDVRATAAAIVIAIPHEVGRVRTAMALSWSGSYN